MTEYVALGDGFSSGPGLGSYSRDSLSRSPQALCMRSANAWPERMRVDPPRSALVWSFACRTAVLDDLTDHSVEDGLVAQMRRPQLNRDTDLVTLTVGIDDVGLRLGDGPRALVECLDLVHVPGACKGPGRRHTDAEIAALRDDVARGLLAFESRLDRALRVLRSRIADQTTVVVLGYPQLVRIDPGTACAFSKLQIPRRNTKRELRLVHAAIATLNKVLRDGARRRGFFYLPTDEHFAGHEVCGAAHDDWIAGVTDEVFDIATFKIVSPMPMGDGSFMPDMTGHAQYGRALVRFLDQALRRDRDGQNPSGLPHNPAPTGAAD